MPKIFNTLDKIKPLFDWTDKIVMIVCKLLLIADILISCLTVLQRYIPNKYFPPMPWGEQLVLTFMVYMAVLSAALAIRSNSHIRMTAFDKFLPRKLVLCSDVLADLLVMALGVVMLVYGIQVCNGPLAKFGRYESIPTLSKMWMYIPIPLAGFSMIVFELECLYNHIKAFFIPADETAGKEVQA